MAISKAQRKQQQSAADAFDAFFVHEYGAERWHRLRERLLQPTEYAALINAYVPSIEVDRAILSDEAAAVGQYTLLRLPPPPDTTSCDTPTRLLCLLRTDPHGSRPFPPPHPAADARHRLHTHWNLDAASVLAAQCLDIQPGHAVLDMCAAPGGKSITLAQRLWPALYVDHPSGEQQHRQRPSILHANEVDVARHRRLHANLTSYLPPTLFEQGLVDVLLSLIHI